MATSRRDFIKTGTLVALATGLPLASLQKVLGYDLPGSSLAGLTLRGFAEHLNTDFIIHHSNSRLTVKLVDVKALRAVTSRGEAFSLLFRGNHSPALAQHTYVIDHGKLGRFSFLLVPVRTRDDSAHFYEAIVNRLRA